MAQLTDPFARPTDTRPLDLHPGAVDPGLHDPRRPRRLVTVVVGMACVAALAVVVELAGTSSPLHSGAGSPAPAVTATGLAPAPAGTAGAGAGAGSDGSGAAAPQGAGGATSGQNGSTGTSGGTDGATEEPGQPGQNWATVRISSPAHLTFPAGHHVSLWAKATLDDGTAVAGAKLRWRIWSEPEHALVYSHQGPHAFAPVLPVGRYTVGISIVDPTISGGLKRTVVVAEEGSLVLPTPTPVVTGPGSLAPQTPDGP